MALLIFGGATASPRPGIHRNYFLRPFIVTISMIISLLTIIQAVGRDKMQVIESRRDSKERTRKLRNGNNNVFTTSFDYDNDYDYGLSMRTGDVSRTPATPFTGTPTPCHILSESSPGIYGSTEGSVVEVSFQYDVVTNKTLQDSIYPEVIQNIEMKLTHILAEALMTPCQSGGRRLEKTAILGGVSCYPADTSGGSPFDTEDGHLCSPVNGAVSVYFTSGDTSDKEFIIESSIKRIFEDGLLNSAHTGILEAHYKEKDYESSSASASDNILGDVSDKDDEQCHSYLEEMAPGVYGDCKKGTVVTASYQYDVVTNPVSKFTYEEVMQSLQMKLSYLIAEDLGSSCGNDQDQVQEIVLGGVSCYPADESESEPFDTEDGHLCSPMIGFVSLYLLDNNTRNKEMLVQNSIEKIMYDDKLTSVHPDIFAVKYVSSKVFNQYTYLSIDVKANEQSWKQLSLATIAIAVAGIVLGLISIGILVKKQHNKSSQLSKDDAIDAIDRKFILTMSAFTPRTLSASDATVKMSNKSLSLTDVMMKDLDESTIGSTGRFDEIYAFDEDER